MLQFVVSDYSAQGEGSTRCILITKAYPRHDDYEESNSHMNTNGTFHWEMPKLKEGVTPQTIALRQFIDEFGAFYVSGARFISEEEFISKWIHHCPAYMKKIILEQNDKQRAAGNVYYASKLHLNYS